MSNTVERETVNMDSNTRARLGLRDDLWVEMARTDREVGRLSACLGHSDLEDAFGPSSPHCPRATSSIIGVTGFPADEKRLDKVQTAPHHTLALGAHISLLPLSDQSLPSSCLVRSYSIKFFNPI